MALLPDSLKNPLHFVREANRLVRISAEQVEDAGVSADNTWAPFIGFHPPTQKQLLLQDKFENSLFDAAAAAEDAEARHDEIVEGAEQIQELCDQFRMKMEDFAGARPAIVNKEGHIWTVRMQSILHHPQVGQWVRKCRAKIHRRNPSTCTVTTPITKKLTTEQISSLFDDLTEMEQVLNSIDCKLDIAGSQKRQQETLDDLQPRRSKRFQQNSECELRRSKRVKVDVERSI